MRWYLYELKEDWPAKIFTLLKGWRYADSMKDHNPKFRLVGTTNDLELVRKWSHNNAKKIKKNR